MVEICKKQRKGKKKSLSSLNLKTSVPQSPMCTFIVFFEKFSFDCTKLSSPFGFNHDLSLNLVKNIKVFKMAKMRIGPCGTILDITSKYYPNNYTFYHRHLSHFLPVLKDYLKKRVWKCIQFVGDIYFS